MTKYTQIEIMPKFRLYVYIPDTSDLGRRVETYQIFYFQILQSHQF